MHCDWSKRAAGRWMAEARRCGDGWVAEGPRPVGDVAALVDRLFEATRRSALLAAFDFPIGLPADFGRRTGLADFSAALDAFGSGAWSRVYDVAAEPGEIGPGRPFYPDKPGAARLVHLLDRHGAAAIGDLLRGCERAGADSGSAGCMFWTMGAKQVGKAAIHGWQHVVAPARRRGARLWPFDGRLSALARPGVPTLAESYPGDAYGQLGLKVRGKGDRRVRAAVGPALLDWAARRNVALEGLLEAAIRGGFDRAEGGDDGFDAVIGLLAGIALVRGERGAGAPDTDDVRRWEGWILGRAA